MGRAGDGEGAGLRVPLRLASGLTPGKVLPLLGLLELGLGLSLGDGVTPATALSQYSPVMSVPLQSHDAPSPVTVHKPGPQSMEEQPVTCSTITAKAMVPSWEAASVALVGSTDSVVDMAAKAPFNTYKCVGQCRFV